MTSPEDQEILQLVDPQPVEEAGQPLPPVILTMADGEPMPPPLGT